MDRDAAASPRAEDPEAAVRGLRVLVVEGSEEGRRSLGILLRSLGLEPTLIAQAQSASEELRRAARAGQPYALVLFDSTLRGSAAFRARRAQDDPLFSITPRIELAAEERSAPLERGPVLPRPVTRGALLAVLEQVLGRGRAAPARPPAPTPASGPKLRVLLMGPDPVSALVMARLVELAGGDPVVVHSLEQALAAAESVEAALLDATRPEVGTRLECLRRSRPGLRVLGFYGQESSDFGAPAGGFDGYVDLTLDADDLRARLTEPRADKAPMPAARPDAPVFDRRRLASRLGDDDEAAQRVLQRFLERADAHLRDLGEAAAGADGRAIEQQAHRIRGGLAWIGAERAASVAADVERLCRSGEKERAAELCQTLRQETERVVAAIREAAESPSG